MAVKKKQIVLQRKAITPAEAEQIYGTPVGTLANWRGQGRGPRYFKVSRKVFYLVKDFDSWFTQNPVLTIESLPEE